MSSGGRVGHIVRTFKETLVFTGRSRRSEVIDYYVFYFAVMVGFTFLLGRQFPVWVGDALSWLLILPTIAQFCRRVHDHDRSGWWTILLIAFLIVGECLMASFAGQLALPSRVFQSYMAILFVILVVVTIVLSFMRGTDGPNRFGPDPRPEWYDDTLD